MNHYGKQQKKRCLIRRAIRKLAEHGHCKYPDVTHILLTTIQRLELYEHVIAGLEDQVQTLILDSLNQEKSVGNGINHT